MAVRSYIVTTLEKKNKTYKNTSESKKFVTFANNVEFFFVGPDVVVKCKL